VAGQYFFEPMSEPYARAIVAWRYPGQYTIYNMESDADVEADVQVLLDLRYAYHAVLDAEGDLVGFCCFGADAQVPGGDYSDPSALDVGLGLRPDLAGQGRGLGFLEAIMDFARERFGATRFRATIADFNVRSRRVFEKAGYVQTQRFRSMSAQPLEFVVVVMEPDTTLFK
jgi:RimJ/RimL family protein N-acetyltransferase